MAKLAAPKKPTAKSAPKKPTSRSKTGNAECSAAASNWQLSIRGKATLNPGTYQTLAKCRALSKSGQMADAQGRTGKLSDQGAAALKGRLQKRFDSGLITQKSRQDRLEMLLKQRSQQRKPTPPPAVQAAPQPARYSLQGKLAPGRGKVATPKLAQAATLPQRPGFLFDPGKSKAQTIVDSARSNPKYQQNRLRAKVNQNRVKSEIESNPTSMGVFRGSQRSKNAVYSGKLGLNSRKQREARLSGTKKELAEKRSEREYYANATPAKPTPARYSLGGKLAPGRGTEKRKNRVSLKIYERSERNAQRAYAAGAIPLSDKKRIGADENFVATIFQSETGGPGRQRFAKAVKTVSGADRAAVQIESVKEGGKYGVIDPVSGFGAGLNYKKQADAKSVAIRMDRLTKRASREQGGGILSLNDVASGKGGSRYQELLKSVVRRELRRSGQSGRASRIR